MDEAALAGDGSTRAVTGPRTELERLHVALRGRRRVWRWHWQRFWTLRWENSLRRPGWRVDAEDRAWQRMREDVRHYAQLRRRRAALAADLADARERIDERPLPAGSRHVPQPSAIASL